ncbi:hypothetical protein [Pseudomonas allii]|uniref:hypothetical protein n=1 Tax=Pseudomonas allii TaxID=2740531 RepID=UPI003CC60A72
MTIKLRLMLLIATGLLTALIMSLAGYLGNTRMGNAVQNSELSMTVLRNHMEADMMHDACVPMYCQPCWWAWVKAPAPKRR